MNNVGDQTYIKGTQAGYSSSLGGTSDNVDISYKGTGDDIWSHGFWAHGGRNIEYSFELKKGIYYVNEGFFEWWNTERYMKITVSGGGKERTVVRQFREQKPWYPQLFQKVTGFRLQ